jgi:hypothetical protein
VFYLETYIEKYLAYGERIVTGKDNLLCFSKSIIVKNIKSNSLMIEGPGFVFISAPESVSRGRFPRFSTIGLVFMLIVVFEMLAMHILTIINE